MVLVGRDSIFSDAVKLILVLGDEPSLGWSSCSRQPKTSHSLACLAPYTCLALLGLVRIIVVMVMLVMLVVKMLIRLPGLPGTIIKMPGSPTPC